jgi:hypothetical protein
MDARIRDLLDRLQRSRFEDMRGTQVSARVPIAERLLNEMIGSTLPAGGAVREVRVRPRSGNKIDVQVKLARPAFLPPLNLTAVIERQPEFPRAPELVIRLSSLPGVMSIAGGAAAFFNVLPPGVRMEGDRVVIDMAELSRRHGHDTLLDFVRRLHVTTVDGAMVLEVELGV